MIWVEVGILIAQIITAVVSYFTIYRHRAVYSIKTAVLRMPHGTSLDRDALETSHIDKLLKEGKFTILQIVERNADKDLEIIMGQIKK
ncbi:MAG: hypothetical protein ABIB93_03155 [Chloroflexota bacterium]